MGEKDNTPIDKHSMHYTSGKDVWCTPKEFFRKLNEIWNFTLDAACMKETALCEKYFTPDDNSLIQDWSNDIVWLNPPYSDLKSWLGKAVQEHKRGATVVILVPSRTDTKAFQDYAVPECDCICFIKGRLKFLDPECNTVQNSAPFPSCLIVLDKDLTEEKVEYLQTIGRVMKNV